MEKESDLRRLVVHGMDGEPAHMDVLVPQTDNAIVDHTRWLEHIHPDAEITPGMYAEGEGVEVLEES